MDVRVAGGWMMPYERWRDCYGHVNIRAGLSVGGCPAFLHGSMTRLAVVFAICLCIASCTAIYRPTVKRDPAATFGAHRVSKGLDIDRLERGRTATLRPVSWLRLSCEPTYALTAEGQRIAAFWMHGIRVVVRREASEGSPPIGRIDPSWDENAIRLAIRPAEGPSFQTDPFIRQQTGGGPDRLSRIAQTVLDVRGSYEAVLRDEKGAAVGNLHVRITPYQEAARVYEFVLPPAIPPALAVAAAASLDAEIDWIEDHAVNVYRGSGAGHLGESIPIGK